MTYLLVEIVCKMLSKWNNDVLLIDSFHCLTHVDIHVYHLCKITAFFLFTSKAYFANRIRCNTRLGEC